LRGRGRRDAGLAWRCRCGAARRCRNERSEQPPGRRRPRRGGRQRSWHRVRHHREGRWCLRSGGQVADGGRGRDLRERSCRRRIERNLRCLALVRGRQRHQVQRGRAHRRDAVLPAEGRRRERTRPVHEGEARSREERLERPATGAPVDFDENPMVAWVWTGTEGSGEVALSTCKSWTSASASDTGATGNARKIPESTTTDWTALGNRPCDSKRRFYCFQKP